VQPVAERSRVIGYWLLGIASTLLGAAGQLLFRRFGQAQNPRGLADWLTLDMSALEIPAGAAYLIVGVSCYVVAVPLWIRVLRGLPLSRVYPLFSLSYPLVYLGAIGWLDESMSLTRTLGTTLVTLGALLAVMPASVGTKPVD